MSNPPFVYFDEQKKHIKIEGKWDFNVEQLTLCALKNALEKDVSTIEFDSNASIDIAFVVFFHKSLKNNKPNIIADDAIKSLLCLTQSAQNKSLPKESMLKNALINLSEYIEEFLRSSIDFINFVGMSLYFLGVSILKRDIRIKPLIYHINESGFKALPVSLLTAFIAGFAITLQGADQLEALGVPLMSVETTAKLSLREMGPFILALVIAGRSASSFTAQIGGMQLTEEVDAMNTMDFNPICFLVLPRLLALMLVMPLLVFLVDACSLFGGMIAIYTQIGLDFNAYITRFYETVGWSHFWIGIVKAPFFGAAIALVGCFRGFCIKNNTQELGTITTISVVNALFWIITMDAIFSFLTTRLGV